MNPNNKPPKVFDREAKGCLAYETFEAAMAAAGTEALRIYPAWECLYPDQQEAWREVGAKLWQAGFEAGSDFMSAVLTNIWSPLPEGTEF